MDSDGEMVMKCDGRVRSGKVTHGMRRRPEYRIWHYMRQRCNNPNNIEYHNYGGRGIRVCAEWDLFENFYADMGERPEGKTLDRRDNNGNYEPENCRWADLYEQQANTRKAKRCRIHGIEYPTLSAAARAVGIHRATMQWRINHKFDGYEVPA